ncbi:gamma-glutamyl-gamma-aminobutyrate hydrolase family protein [Hazenella sp. IB182357]|uniref:Gamma-glutamyl-gamma-aminobutyrate hydrolase family protein n=1 Tax=Polycladospora coralii TaxID=2771432 RepID=A0A926N5U0_9BACL|nr:gamma-glutamyl-gamma-aminobutyrate hydrolase family protein [Polycladospora coralii]MBD1371231.1 gamma-glutamyl-gamma-aminobutyrate hydrolase family protein [Polycladospora coralii]
MKPVIGITMSLEHEQKQTLRKDYSDSVIVAGGMPILLPYCTEQEVVMQMVEQIDGLVLSGGGDIDPSLFDEDPHPELRELTPQRDHMEMQLIKQCQIAQKPILAICRGCQILNIALGGDMYQDLGTQKDFVIQHTQQAPRSYASHQITIQKESALYQILGKSRHKVNSYHHQANRRLAPSLRAVAWSTDGVIEAIEQQEGAPIMGVQWHPECMTQTDIDARKLFAWFVQICQPISK